MKKAKKIAITLLILLLTMILGALLVNRFFPVRHMDEIEKHAKTYDLSPALVCAVIRTESGFRANVVSKAGASGLMQLMQSTADWGSMEIGLRDYDYTRIHEPGLNIQLGCWYLRKLIDQYGFEETALAAYNAGSGNVSNWLSNPQYSTDGQTLDVIPFGETARYVKKIERNKQIYNILLRIRGHL